MLTKAEKQIKLLRQLKLVKQYVKEGVYDGTGIISVSGGETSMMMAIWIKRNLPKLKKVFIFDNTSRENEETLKFIDWCDKHYNLGVIWLEAVITVKRVIPTPNKTIKESTYVFCPIEWNRIKRKYWKSKVGKKRLKQCPQIKFREPLNIIVKDSGLKSKVVNFETACRDGRIFEQQIAKEGIPNTANPSCTSRLKVRTTLNYVRNVLKLKHKDCLVAVGIRSDEVDRMKISSEIGTPFYAFISLIQITKPRVNFFWKNEPRRLELEGWEGNCQSCFKKALRKLLTIAKKFKERFTFELRAEKNYGYYIPDARLKKLKDKGEEPKYPITYFRKNMSAKQILELSKQDFEEANDDSIIYDETKIEGFELDKVDSVDGDCSESCEAF